MIKFIQIKVGKQLRSEISDWKTFVFFSIKQAFRWWQPFPFTCFAFNNATVFRVIENGFTDQVKNSFYVSVDFPRVDNDRLFDLFIQQRLVNRHEIALNIHLQDIAIIVIILRTGSDKMVYPLYPVMGSLSFSATVTVVDKALFKNRGNVIENKVVNNPVAKTGGKYLPFYRLIYNKTNARARFVAPVNDFIVQLNEIVFIILLEFQSIISVPLIAAG